MKVATITLNCPDRGGTWFLQRAVGNTIEEQLTLERDLQRQAGRLDDCREGVAAFMAKHKPEFKRR